MSKWSHKKPEEGTTKYTFSEFTLYYEDIPVDSCPISKQDMEYLVEILNDYSYSKDLGKVFADGFVFCACSRD